MALGVLIADHWIGQRPDAAGQVGDQAGELAPAGAEVFPQLLGVGDAHEVRERLGDRLVGDAHDGVARPVEHEHALGGGLMGELAHEPALARSRLAAEQGHAPPLAAGTRQQRSQ